MLNFPISGFMNRSPVANVDLTKAQNKNENCVFSIFIRQESNQLDGQIKKGQFIISHNIIVNKHG